MRLGWLYQTTECPRQAIDRYTKAIELNPGLATAYGNRGIARHLLGEVGAAIKDYDRVVQLGPYDAKAYYNRGIARSDQGNLTAAIQDYDKAIAVNPQYADAYNKPWQRSPGSKVP